MTSMTTDEFLALRVAVRHAAVVLRDDPHATTGGIYADDRLVTDMDVIRLLRDRLGVLMRLRFRPSIAGMPNEISWEAVSEDDEIISGRLMLHAGVRETEVVSWTEIVIDGEGPTTRTAAEGSPTEQLLRRRLRRIENIMRDLIEDSRYLPQLPLNACVTKMMLIVEEAEGA
jgi:hypothetical protein